MASRTVRVRHRHRRRPLYTHLICSCTYAVIYVEECAIFVMCVRRRDYSEVGVSRGDLSWPIHTAVPADDVTTRALTSQLLPAYDVIGVQ